MAEANFEFVTTSVIADPKLNGEDSTRTAADEHKPTDKDVTCIVSLIEKCSRLAVDSREFRYLREVSLLNVDCGHHRLAEHGRVTRMNSAVRRQLHAYSLRPLQSCDPLRYASLLLVLPELCSVWPQCLETLFCSQIVKARHTRDIDTLLVDMLIGNSAPAWSI